MSLELAHQWLLEQTVLGLPNFVLLLPFAISLVFWIISRKKAQSGQSKSNRRQSSRRAEDNYPDEDELSKMDQTMPAQKLKPRK